MTKKIFAEKEKVSFLERYLRNMGSMLKFWEQRGLGQRVKDAKKLIRTMELMGLRDTRGVNARTK